MRGDGKPRKCMDYRQPNKRIRPDKFLTTNMKKITVHFKERSFFITIDLFSGYRKIPVAEDYRVIPPLIIYTAPTD